MNTQKTLKQAREEIDCEDDLQAWMERGMESNGWTVLREVTARHKNVRADIIAKHDEIGAIGIECKYVTGGPVVAGHAASQVCNNYAGEKFFQWDIDAWGICLFGASFEPRSMIDKGEFDNEEHYLNCIRTKRNVAYTTQRVVNGLGIGFVTTNKDRLVMQFLPTGRENHIPLFSVDNSIPPDYFRESDIERISKLVKSRRP